MQGFPIRWEGGPEDNVIQAWIDAQEAAPSPFSDIIHENIEDQIQAGIIKSAVQKFEMNRDENIPDLLFLSYVTNATTCPVCLEEINPTDTDAENDEEETTLACGHRFCRDCLKNLANQPNCACCRRPNIKRK